ncbi:hypothetical protein N9523_05600 [Flavobacteriaceae bacterium]|nr:hypothetical protein [Flavobacteriaceae bacterium]
MKTKTFNHFRNLFAFVGFFIIACSAAVELDSADNPDDIPPIVQNNNGKYQATLADDGNVPMMTVLNTESGSSKTYYWRLYSDGSYVWQEASSVKFTH